MSPGNDDALKSMFRLLASGQAAIHQHRSQARSWLKHRGAELAAKESTLHGAPLPSDVAAVLSGKKLLLLAECLQKCGYHDVDLIKDISCGFRVTGELSPTGCFPEKIRPAVVAREDLWATARRTQRAVASGRPGDKLIDRAVCDSTIVEVDNKWASGPWTPAQLDQRHGPLWLPARRFGVSQGSKIRPIDDFSEFQVNASLGTSERISLEGLDEALGI